MAAAAWAQGPALISSISGTSTPGNNESSIPSISGNGRYVAFTSDATDIVPGLTDGNAKSDVFLRDRATGTTVCMSKSSAANATGSNLSLEPRLSADGKFATFQSFSNNLVTGLTDSNAKEDIFLYEVATGIVRCVTVSTAGNTTANNTSPNCSISQDGRYVAFQSSATNLVAGVSDGADSDDIFLRDTVSNTTTLVSVASNTTTGGIGPLISLGGSAITYYNFQDVGITGVTDTNFNGDVYWWQRSTATTKILSVIPDGTKTGSSDSNPQDISADGRFVAFVSTSNDLTTNDSNSTADVFLRDTTNDTTVLVSAVPANNAGGNQGCDTARVSADGNLVVFVSQATNLTGIPDGNIKNDVFLRNVGTATTTMISKKADGTSSGNGNSLGPDISDDGKVVSFRSTGSDMLAGDGNASQDAFLYDVQTAVLTLASRNTANTGGGNGDVQLLALSIDGKYLSYHSAANDLVASDGNNALDVFVFPPTFTIPSIQFSAASYSVNEAGPNATITVTRTNSTSGASSATFSTIAGGTATPGAGNDYTTTTVTVNFANGDATKNVLVPINNDPNVEGSETVKLALTNPNNAVLGNPNSNVFLTIVDNDNASSFTITGRIADTGGVAISGVNVTRTGNVTVVTNGAGYFTFTGVVPGNYTLTPAKAGLIFNPTSRSVSVTNANLTGQNFTGGQPFSITGRVAGTNGAALVGVNVTRTGGVTVATNGAGYYTFTNVLAGTYTVTPSQSGLIFVPASRSVTITNANVANQNFTGGQGFSITGRCSLSNGTALANVSVTRTGGVTVLSNGAGYFTFTNVLAGSYALTPSLAGNTFTPPSRTVTISNANIANQNFVSGFTISGRVTASNGTGVTGVVVTRTGGPAGSGTATATTNSGGYYTIFNCQPGTYTLTPSKSGSTFNPASKNATVTNANIAGVNFVAS